jgi:hypothetical protein
MHSVIVIKVGCVGDDLCMIWEALFQDIDPFQLKVQICCLAIRNKLIYKGQKMGYLGTFFEKDAVLFIPFAAC